MTGWGYVGFAALTVGMAVMSGALAFVFNPVSLVMMAPASWLARALRGVPLWVATNSDDLALLSVAWPLTLAPLHWLAFRRLAWNGWGYAALVLLTGVTLGLTIVLYRHGGRAWTGR